MKRGRMKLSIITLSITILLLGCSLPLTNITGSDTTIKKEFSFTDFNKIAVSSLFVVDIVQADEYKVVVEYNDNFEEYLKISQDGENIKIGMSGKNMYENAKLSATVHLPFLNSIKASGASSVSLPELSTSSIDIDISGASKLNGSIVVEDNLKLKASGASTLSLQGSAYNAEIKFSGATSLTGKEIMIENSLKIECSGVCHINNTILSASNVSIESSGTPEIQCGLTVSDELSIDASGASSINLQGNSKTATISTSGASSISSRNMTIIDMLKLDSSGASSVTLNTDGDINVELSGASVFNKYGNGNIVNSKVSTASSINNK